MAGKVVGGAADDAGLGWKDYVALFIALIETLAIPLVILIVALIVVLLVLGAVR